MPIEIKEMHIKINVSEGSKTETSDKSGDGNKVIEECLEAVSALLKNKDER